MGSEVRNKWIGGILLPLGLAVWGISSLASQEVTIPLRGHSWPWAYEHLTVRAWPATCIAVAMLLCAVAVHFASFWSGYPKTESLASIVAFCTGWAAGILFTTGIVAWVILGFAGFIR